MERTIKVTGKGKLSVKPDLIRLIITLTHLEKEYKGAILESADKKGNLVGRLRNVGFEKEDLKTVSFDVRTEYESYQDKKNNWKNRLTGYRYTHVMKLEFPADNERLGQVLYELAQCPGEPEFSIQHTISDVESAKNVLLAKAVADSKAKAEVLTEAAGVKLKEIVNIDYSWGEVDFVTRPVHALMMNGRRGMEMEKSAVNLDIEADDIDVTDSVTVVWRIE